MEMSVSKILNFNSVSVFAHEQFVHYRVPKTISWSSLMVVVVVLSMSDLKEDQNRDPPALNVFVIIYAVNRKVPLIIIIVVLIRTECHVKFLRRSDPPPAVAVVDFGCTQHRSERMDMLLSSYMETRALTRSCPTTTMRRVVSLANRLQCSEATE